VDTPPPPWDGLRAAFYLVAAMLIIQMMTAIAAGAWCIYAAEKEILAGTFQCNRDGQLSELLNAALTTALAFAMAFMNRDKKGD